MSARRQLYPPIPLVLVCACGSDKIIACQPGTDPRRTGKVVPFVKPPPDPMVCWCAACWPWSVPRHGKRKSKVRH